MLFFWSLILGKINKNIFCNRDTNIKSMITSLLRRYLAYLTPHRCLIPTCKCRLRILINLWIWTKNKNKIICLIKKWNYQSWLNSNLTNAIKQQICVYLLGSLSEIKHFLPSEIQYIKRILIINLTILCCNVSYINISHLKRIGYFPHSTKYLVDMSFLKFWS